VEVHERRAAAIGEHETIPAVCFREMAAIDAVVQPLSGFRQRRQGISKEQREVASEKTVPTFGDVRFNAAGRVEKLIPELEICGGPATLFCQTVHLAFELRRELQRDKIIELLHSHETTGSKRRARLASFRKCRPVQTPLHFQQPVPQSQLTIFEL
jgi:hypothetical protein